ncbi:MAG: Ig-like domain repeat protein [Anaerolineales bacterium]|nr:Ig-like domain repeat protein [Anaerolineales bacterium]
MTNVIFSRNYCWTGAAIANAAANGTANPTLTNVTFSQNWADDRGGAILNSGINGVITSTLKNVILWGNTAARIGPQIYNEQGLSVIDYSIVQGGDSGIAGNNGLTAFSDGTGNLNADPLFVNPASDNLNLQWGSPAINTGTTTGAPSTDIRGTPRPVQVITDMGAYEFSEPKLGLAKQVTPTTGALYGGVVTYTLILSNTGTISDTTLLTDTLPAQATAVNNEVRWHGTITDSTTLTFTFTASYTWDRGAQITNTALFSGSMQAGSAAATFTQSVTPASTAVAVTAAPNPTVVQNAVTFTATVSPVGSGGGVPTGYVTFTVGANVFTATLDANGVATTQRTDVVVGNHAVSATYAGDNNFATSSNTGANQVVNCTSAYVINNTADAGAGSLRQALTDACESGTVTFDPALTAGGPVTITLTGGWLFVDKSITVAGPDADLVRVSGNDASTVFAVGYGVNCNNLRLDDPRRALQFKAGMAAAA